MHNVPQIVLLLLSLPSPSLAPITETPSVNQLVMVLVRLASLLSEQKFIGELQARARDLFLSADQLHVERSGSQVDLLPKGLLGATPALGGLRWLGELLNDAARLDPSVQTEKWLVVAEHHATLTAELAKAVADQVAAGASPAGAASSACIRRPPSALLSDRQRAVDEVLGALMRATDRPSLQRLSPEEGYELGRFLAAMGLEVMRGASTPACCACGLFQEIVNTFVTLPPDPAAATSKAPDFSHQAINARGGQA